MYNGRNIILAIVVPVTLVLATTGCASKKYVRNQVNATNQKVSALQAKTEQQIAYLNNQQKSDMSQVNERIDGTEHKLAEVSQTANQANSSAAQAMQQGQANQTAITAANNNLSALSTGVANALNYKLVDKSDVTFAFGSAKLTPAAKASLDQIVAKVQSMPRVVVELAGFTDPIGSPSYNLALSRRRAEAVQRYLVERNVPLRSIHLIGLGEAALHPEAGTRMSKAEAHRMARRVNIDVYGAGEISAGTAARSEE
jgi:OOP family OmpA-OmpF porin